MDLTVSLYKIHAHQGLPSNLPPAPILLIKRINFISGTQPRANLQGLVQSTPDRLILSDGEYNMRGTNGIGASRH
ncbi:hypothetical protein NEOLI_000617 [Neolecta irregularis DAH-3]|uniref:Uncharacterized protein n=1 Tax=Neolecta irregularis (strain DAH-3) TaxID=1198029 RepID=A0A1U7LUB8_NEOID|nr:hypothetical protein NEOLI_000617 [Neolecta irregularis DAH-3]|eukprot:OLL26111.1 hypothetical protein NEOLI_000617 [Neolecta irregularis DAH-3]